MRSFVKKDSRLLRREQALKSNLKKRKINYLTISNRNSLKVNILKIKNTHQ